MKNRIIACVTALMLAAMLAGCGEKDKPEKSAETSANGESQTQNTGTQDILFSGDGYTIMLEGSKWVNRDSYIETLKAQGYTFDEEDLEGKNADGCYYFTDPSVKNGADNGEFTYDTPHLTIAAPRRSDYFNKHSIEECIEDGFSSEKELYDSVDGMDFVEEESGIKEIGENKFLKKTIRNTLAGGEIVLVKMTYDIYSKGAKYSFTFSSTDKLAPAMEAEYEKVLSTFTA